MSIFGFRSVGITDKGVEAVAQGCPGLQMINLSYCEEITDSSLISLSKCSKMNTVEIRGCPQISSNGLSAIAVGCRQLSKIDVKKCFRINDAGMIPLACLSRNLREVDGHLFLRAQTTTLRNDAIDIISISVV